MWTAANRMYWKNTNSLHLRLIGLVLGEGLERRGKTAELLESDDLAVALRGGTGLAVSVVCFSEVHFDGVFA